MSKLTPDLINKPSVVKAQMAEWLFSAIYLLDQCSLPLMSDARTQKKMVSVLLLKLPRS